MAKSKSMYVCQNCGAKRTKWEGRCSDCSAWNSFVEEKPAPAVRQGWVEKRTESGNAASSSGMDVYNLIDTPDLTSGSRISTGMGEVDRVLGGGLVKGSYILLGGDPGIGKSTIVMQIAGALAKQNAGVLYISAEESVQQTALRARRLGLTDERVDLASESNLDAIVAAALARQPAVLIVDSIQTVYTSDVESAPGSVSQVRECAARLLSLAKQKGVTVIIIGHVTKDGSLAGPRVLEHMVDTVLAFEGDQHQQFRLLRALKNRFGATNELGVFSMTSDGLTEVPNPSELFLEERRADRYGSAVFAAMEGSRPVLCEMQALTTTSPLPNPRRNAIGLDVNRVHMLSAVLDKHTSVALGNRDIYANVVGGLRITEPAVDLALVAAMISSDRGAALPDGSCFFGEVGLTGEVRGAGLAVERVKEAAKLGFKHIYLPASNERYLKAKDYPGVEFHWIKDVGDIENLLGGKRERPKREPGPGASYAKRPGGKPSKPPQPRAPGETTIGFDYDPEVDF